LVRVVFFSIACPFGSDEHAQHRAGRDALRGPLGMSWV
jgi:hypothetical protein